MRPTRVMGLAGLSIAMLGASANAEIESEFAIGAHTDYIFRGVDVGENLYDYSLNFTGDTTCGITWNAGIWYANFDAGSGEFENPFPDDPLIPETINISLPDEELDIYGGVAKDFGCVNVELGFIRYIYPDIDNAGNTEVYLSAGASFNVIDISATFYYNVDADSYSFTESGDWYAELAAVYGFDINDTLDLELGVSVAFFDTENGGDGFANYQAYLGLNQQVSDNVTISPYIQYSYSDDEYNGDFAGDGRDYFFGGIKAAYSF